jgi:hypothetical protein
MSKKSRRREYRAPIILTYSSDDILQELGPAQACSPYWHDDYDVPAPPNSPGYAPGLPPIQEPPAKKKGKLF